MPFAVDARPLPKSPSRVSSPLPRPQSRASKSPLRASALARSPSRLSRDVLHPHSTLCVTKEATEAAQHASLTSDGDGARLGRQAIARMGAEEPRPSSMPFPLHKSPSRLSKSPSRASASSSLGVKDGVMPPITRGGELSLEGLHSELMGEEPRRPGMRMIQIAPHLTESLAPQTDHFQKQRRQPRPTRPSDSPGRMETRHGVPQKSSDLHHHAHGDQHEHPQGGHGASGGLSSPGRATEWRSLSSPEGRRRVVRTASGGSTAPSEDQPARSSAKKPSTTLPPSHQPTRLLKMRGAADAVRNGIRRTEDTGRAGSARRTDTAADAVRNGIHREDPADLGEEIEWSEWRSLSSPTAGDCGTARAQLRAVLGTRGSSPVRPRLTAGGALSPEAVRVRRARSEQVPRSRPRSSEAMGSNGDYTPVVVRWPSTSPQRKCTDARPLPAPDGSRVWNVPNPGAEAGPASPHAGAHSFLARSPLARSHSPLARLKRESTHPK